MPLDAKGGTESPERVHTEAMTFAYVLVIVAFILAVLAIHPPLSTRFQLLAAAFASYMLSILVLAGRVAETRTRYTGRLRGRTRFRRWS